MNIRLTNGTSIPWDTPDLQRSPESDFQSRVSLHSVGVKTPNVDENPLSDPFELASSSHDSTSGCALRPDNFCTNSTFTRHLQIVGKLNVLVSELGKHACMCPIEDQTKGRWYSCGDLDMEKGAATHSDKSLTFYVRATRRDFAEWQKCYTYCFSLHFDNLAVNRLALLKPDASISSSISCRQETSEKTLFGSFDPNTTRDVYFNGTRECGRLKEPKSANAVPVRASP